MLVVAERKASQLRSIAVAIPAAVFCAHRDVHLHRCDGATEVSRNPFTPTDDQRRLVRTMAGFGVPHDDIALVTKCSPPTLRKWFRHELDVATIEANARVAQTLYQQATTPGNIAATIFWLKARAGWREKHAIEVTGRDGAPLPAPQLIIERRIIDPGRGPEPSVIEGRCE
ncbi:hypothetical protein ACFQU2_38145 [Siccirubricoccus deserti]|uniref:Uncharacterized protein n=1 Tax=Siccirubricoccus deserti TaxID=2013562 RepID=A0A9X0R644_9PROT|nr:hypothetical protein [Siccirubricoccus deserti]MBC4019082.1 hypothetical protein [Siccirubricoccus deserti]